MEGKRIIKVLDKKDFTFEDAIRGAKTWTVFHTDTGGYTEGEFDIHVFGDGSVALDGEHDGQYFHFTKEEWNIIKNFVESK